MSIESNRASGDRSVPSASAIAPPKSNRMPRQIRFIIGSEASERFSFYGMRSILTVFMVERLFMAKEDATSVLVSIYISITGLEFAYTQAPRSMKSTLMSFWYLMTFVGDSFTAIIAQLNPFQGANQFLFFAVLMLAVSGIFIRYSISGRLLNAR